MFNYIIKRLRKEVTRIVNNILNILIILIYISSIWGFLNINTKFENKLLLTLINILDIINSIIIWFVDITKIINIIDMLLEWIIYINNKAFQFLLFIILAVCSILLFFWNLIEWMDDEVSNFLVWFYKMIYYWEDIITEYLSNIATTMSIIYRKIHHFIFNINPQKTLYSSTDDINFNNFNTEINKRKTPHIIPINLNINTYSGTNTHFPVYKASIILTLTIWQYWWWLSFIFVILFFNKLTIKFFFQNTLKIEPKIYTSIKSNGRWGDLIASLFPVYWCSNILLNSNLILKAIENHSESGMFLLRVRGKQWYWVYKFSVNIKRDFDKISLIIGRGNKINVTYKFLNQYPDNTSIPSSRWKKKVNYYYLLNKKLSRNDLKIFKYETKINTGYLSLTPNKFQDFLAREITVENKILKKNLVAYQHNKYQMKLPKTFLYLYKTYKCQDKLFILKKKHNTFFKKYNRYFYTIQQQPKSTWYAIKKNNLIYFNNINDQNINIKLKKIKTHSVVERNHFFKKFRMLSTYNTLILPTNVNITVITNSFDVVHSWFIPGLGLKFDCVPGRSTHYTLKIQQPGIYYGHCAEVCGRFHHHMPIKIIALPLHQFNYYYNMYFEL